MLGKKGETKQTRMVTVIRSSVAGSAGGVVMIVLDTKKSGPIGFVVTLKLCAALRREIAAAETFLRLQLVKA